MNWYNFESLTKFDPMYAGFKVLSVLQYALFLYLKLKKGPKSTLIPFCKWFRSQEIWKNIFLANNVILSHKHEDQIFASLAYFPFLYVKTKKG